MSWMTSRLGRTRLAAGVAGLAALALAAAPRVTAAQVESDDRPECLGFAFGAWTPALDRGRAGHAEGPTSAPAAPGGRDWAAATASGGDSVLVLFPGWWPAGVAVRFERPFTGDTLRGEAVAFVADGRVRAPRARVIGWRVPCGGRPAPSPTDAAPPADPAATTPSAPSASDLARDSRGAASRSSPRRASPRA